MVIVSNGEADVLFVESSPVLIRGWQLCICKWSGDRVVVVDSHADAPSSRQVFAAARMGNNDDDHQRRAPFSEMAMTRPRPLQPTGQAQGNHDSHSNPGRMAAFAPKVQSGVAQGKRAKRAPPWDLCTEGAGQDSPGQASGASAALGQRYVMLSHAESVRQEALPHAFSVQFG